MDRADIIVKFENTVMDIGMHPDPLGYVDHYSTDGSWNRIRCVTKWMPLKGNRRIVDLLRKNNLVIERRVWHDENHGGFYIFRAMTEGYFR